MSIMRITALQAEAEVLGKVVQVQYQDGRGLQIGGLSYDEAVLALTLLSAGRVRAVRPDVPAAAPAASAPAAVEVPAPPIEAPAASASAPAEPAKEDPRLPETPAPAAAAPKAPRARRPAAAPAPAAPAAAAAAPVQAELPGAAAPASANDDEVAAKLNDKSCDSLKRAVEIMRAAGVKTADEAAELAARLTDRVPRFKSVRALEDRVRAQFEAGNPAAA